MNEINYKLLIFHCVDALNTYDTSVIFKNNIKILCEKSDLVITPGILLEKELSKYKTNVKKDFSWL